ncbi:G-type lectin S-receptor-like serine/threonine-protein kinase SD3-1 [Euphorbia peplus]|nr:G-type lectin S-receptor-like serine/threonine-protein kinase SD3-1 [Euphorbia peplus]
MPVSPTSSLGTLFHYGPFDIVGQNLEFGVAPLPISGSKLSVDGSDSWVSPNGDFAIGFYNYSDLPNQYRVGIRFNSRSIPVSKQTVVWVAGADVTVGKDSYFQLSRNGELVLVDSMKGVSVWSTKTSQLDVVSALLRDDGNLVLLDKMGAVVWQSFDYPSDTLLPGQNLSVYGTLRASSKNSVSSYYSLYMNATGLLELRWESSVVYWTSGNPSALNLSAVLTSTGVLQLLNQTSEPVWSVFGEDHNDTVNFRLLRLDADGNLRIYSWIDTSKSWKSVWQAVENQCTVFATCGYHGICAFNASGSPECRCPSKRTSSDPNSICFSQNCKSGSIMVPHEHTFLYEVYPPRGSVNHVSLQQCIKLCTIEPACTASTFTNDGTGECRLKISPYFSGYSGPSTRSVSYIKTCNDPVAVDPHFTKSPSAESPAKSSYGLCVPCIAGAASGTVVLFGVLQLVLGCYVYRRRRSIWKKAASAYMGSNSKGLMMLSFAEIKEITGSFKHQIGRNMYRGVLPNHQPVAVKDLETTIEERKFRAVVSRIGSIHHKNLVKLNGYCCESSERVLVYEYVKNGSLEEYLEDDGLSKRLTWRKRVEICLGVARAVCYLHTGCREFISHGNLKCENVVLDKNLEAKVSEFGLGAVRSESETTCTVEKDVGDFGKIVLMLVTGCHEEVNDVCEMAYKEWFEEQPENALDKRIEDEVDIEELERMMRTAFWCLQRDERMRPSMVEVVKVLEGTLTVDPPPPPFDCGPLSPEEESLE